MVDVKTETFLYSIINITTEKYCSVAFICHATRHHFIHTFKKLELPCTAEKIRTARECCLIAFIFNRHTYILSARNEEVRAILFSIISSISHSSNFSFGGSALWDLLRGYTLVIIGQWYLRQPLTNYSDACPPK